MEELEMPALPEADGVAEADITPLPGGGYTYENVPAWSEPLVRAYGAACVASAQCEADATVRKLRALHHATGRYEDACVLRGAELVADALRALSRATPSKREPPCGI